MLAKTWKKILLFICIILCVYNVMHKLVSRTSLETQLKSVEGESSIIDVRNKVDTNSTKKDSNYEKSSYVNSKEQENDKKDENIYVVVN